MEEMNFRSTTGNQYVNSITLGELINKLQSYLISNWDSRNKMIYFDFLHITGEISECGNVLELF